MTLSLRITFICCLFIQISDCTRQKKQADLKIVTATNNTLSPADQSKSTNQALNPEITPRTPSSETMQASRYYAKNIRYFVSPQNQRLALQKQKNNN